RLGPVRTGLPNTGARRRAARYHDLNHVVTGYATDLRGEVEISAWEVGSGCRRFWAAWLLGLSAMLVGATRWPGATVRSFARGRQTRNLYGWDYRVALDTPVAELREALGLTQATSVRPGDIVRFVAWLPVAAAASVVIGLASIVTAPWWLRAEVHRYG